MEGFLGSVALRMIRGVTATVPDATPHRLATALLHTMTVVHNVVNTRTGVHVVEFNDALTGALPDPEFTPYRTRAFDAYVTVLHGAPRDIEIKADEPLALPLPLPLAAPVALPLPLPVSVPVSVPEIKAVVTSVTSVGDKRRRPLDSEHEPVALKMDEEEEPKAKRGKEEAKEEEEEPEAEPTKEEPEVKPTKEAKRVRATPSKGKGKGRRTKKASY
jgi:hypothetical protein